MTLAFGSLFSTQALHDIPKSRVMPGAGEPSLAEVRRATERFRDVAVALAEGYVRDPFDLCDTAAMMGRPASLGAMGVHYVRPDLLGITAPPSPRVNGDGTHTDFRVPGILIYEPQRDGSMTLVAVENLVFAKAWRDAGHSAPPTFHGVPYDSMIHDPSTMADEAHMFRPHFDRHVWIYRENPNGVFAPFNPAVTWSITGGHKSTRALRTRRFDPGRRGMTWTEWAPASSISGPPALCVQIPVDEFPPLEERRSVVGDDGTFDNLRFLREQRREMVADIVGGYSD